MVLAGVCSSKLSSEKLSNISCDSCFYSHMKADAEYTLLYTQKNTLYSRGIKFCKSRQDEQLVQSSSWAFIRPQTGLDHDKKPRCGPHYVLSSCGAAVYMTSNRALPSCLLEVWLLVRSACMDLSLIRHVWQSVQQASTKWKSKHWMASNPSLQETQTFNHK